MSDGRTIRFSVESEERREAVMVVVKGDVEPRVGWSDATQEFSILLSNYSNGSSHYVHLHVSEQTARRLHKALGEQLKMVTGERKWVQV